MRIRTRFGWPRKTIPKRSYASRSFQSAAGHTPTTESISSPSSSHASTRSRAGSSARRRRWYTTVNRFAFGFGMRWTPCEPSAFRSRPACVPMYPATSVDAQPR
jgi:hypothetical protein